MKKWKMVSGVLLVFILGILVGSLGSGFYHQYLSTRFQKDPAERKAFILKKFAERLHLSEGQQAAFRDIIDQMDQKRKVQVQESRAGFRSIREESYTQMKQILDADQQIAFDEMIQEIRERRRNRWSN